MKIFQKSLTYMLFILLVIGVVSTESFSQTVVNAPEYVSLEYAIDLAFKNSEEIHITEKDVEKSRSQYNESKGYYYPHISANFNWENKLSYPVNDLNPKMGNYNYNIFSDVGASQLIYSFGRISNLVKATKNTIKANFYKNDATKKEIKYAAQLAYYGVILRKEILKITEESYLNAQHNKEILETRSASGRVSRKDNIEISADLASRRPYVVSAQADLMTAKNTLKRVMGISLLKFIDVDSSFNMDYEYITHENFIQRLYETEPSLQALETLIVVKDNMLKAKKAELLPSISGFAKWKYNGLDDNNPFIGDDGMSQFGIIGINVSIPIWEGGQIRERVVQAKEDKAIADLEYKKRKKDLSLELENAISEYNQYIDTLKANKTAVSLAKEAFELFQNLFHTGQVSVLELNDAELSLSNGRMNMLETIFKINVAKAQIEKLIDLGEK